jgi:hypothetical protein
VHVGEEGIAVHEHVVDRSSARRCWFIGYHRWRRATIHHLKRGGTQGGVEAGVVAVFGPREPLQPRPRPVAGDASQVHSDCSVDSLGLSVRLRVKRGAHAQLHTCHLGTNPSRRGR